FRALVRATFDDVDVDIDEAESAAEARATIRRRKPDVILLDVRMPGQSGVDAFVAKPFSPLQLLAVVERLAGGVRPVPLVEAQSRTAGNAQLLMYARDLRQLFELERAQRRVLQDAYRQTVSALAEALA